MMADCYQDREMGASVQRAVDTGGTAASLIVGMGGVGKTQLAARYVEALWHDPRLDVLAWVSATSRAAILHTYAQLADQLDHGTSRNPENSAWSLLTWLATTPRRWLIVLDDLQDPDDLDDLWPPRTSTGRVLITTRRRDAAPHRADRRVIDIGVFTDRESRAYLEAKLRGWSWLRYGASALAAELGHLPVALAQACAYITERQVTCAEYLHWFATRRDTTPRRLPDQYETTIDTCWSLSIELANRLSRVGSARPLLELAALLDSSGFPNSLLTTQPVVAYLSDRCGSLLTAIDAHDGLRCLHRLSLAAIDSDMPTAAVRVHELVQRSTRATCDLDRTADLARVCADALLATWPESDRDTNLVGSLRANANALWRHAERYLMWPECHPVLFHAGNSLGNAGFLSSADAHFGKLHQTICHYLGSDHYDALRARHEQARWQGEAGHLATAVAEFQQLLTEYQQILGPDHPATLSARGNLATWRGRGGDAVGAVAEFERLLADQLRVLGATDPSTLLIRSNLVRWREAAGDPATAAIEADRLLDDQLRVLGPDNPYTMITRNHLATLRGRFGDTPGAVAEYQQLLADRSRVLGPDHPDTLLTRSNLATWQSRCGQRAEAIAEFERLHADELRILGSDHPNTLHTRSNLATLRGIGGDANRAITELEAVLADQLRILGASHPGTQVTRENLAQFRASIRRHQDWTGH